MKSRSSNRHRTSDPTDDWVDGSWTVDCICGVNFDDGEEMVDCDECGVWVHTRCFRFGKGEKSFACDKCKKKLIRSTNNNNNNNDSEETEVAQLLVELPTKTIKMSSSNSNSINHNYGNSHANNVYSFGNPPPPPPSRRSPYRLWVNRPMEERVHVQGVPGGDDDPSIFQGFPIVFASELWKCTGYVPKKFNFSYKEFPCWDKEEGVEGEAKANADSKVEGGVENVVDKGAGVLYSLSKENVVFSMKRGQAKSGGSDRKGSKERKLDNGDSKKVSVPSLPKKEKGNSRPIVVQCSSKRSREELGSLKDRSGKKKVKTIRREQDSKKDKVQGIKAAVVHSSSAKLAEVYENKAHKGASNVNLTGADNIEKLKRTVSIDEGNAVRRSPEVPGLGCSTEKRVKDEKPGNDATDSVQNSVKTEIAPLFIAEKDSTARNSIKKEGLVLDAMDKNQGERPDCQTSELSKSKPLAEDVDTDTLECSNNEVAKDVETTVLLISGHCASKSKLDANVDHSEGVMRRPPDINVELESDGTELGTDQVLSSNQECEGSKLNEAVTTSSQSHEHKVQDGDKTLEVVSGSQLLKDEGITENQRNDEVKFEGSENPVEVQKIVSDCKEVTRVEEETSKESGEILPPPASNHRTTSLGKSSPCSSTVVISRSSLSDKNRAGNSSSIGKRAPSNFSLGTKKESAPLDQVKDEVKYEKTKNTLKDHSKSSTNPMSKASHPSKSVTSPALKHHTSLGKDSLRHPFSKKSTAESASLSSSIDEPAGSLQTQHASTGQNKGTASGGQHRHEKAVQPNLQSSSKPTQSSFGHPPPSSNTPAGLSDEELALLLHQELNSSPRVPRVPRVRHAGSLPQSSSASATSILIKRGISGGKDQHTFSRRKNKDGSRSSREQESEARKIDRPPSSPDSPKTSDALTQAEGQSETIHSVRKNPDDISTSAANSGPSSTDANELKSSSTRDSPVNNPEDDTGTNKGLPLIHRTLPGLIAEIMGAGRRMTYEELCNAVLPHWQNLRKHNGERYAYSSHSQAVLDCLRNRSEWARLVDRGPKTNASRKKRKTDVEPPESEDGEDRTQRNAKSKSFESNKEEFPKGRRKARKRRRLALRGRGVRDDRKRTKVVARSEDSGSLSNSSEESGSSEDDSQGSGMCAAKSEVSASSADLVAGQ